jgi:MFS transporter, DHA2 family, methylenomycin A resistance protein
VAGPSIWAFVLWGAGLGFITPAVVAASMGAVQRERAGLASAVNNTARQVGNAIGIAAAGTLAGDPRGAGFVGGLHDVALAAAGLYVVVAALAAVGAPARALSAGVAR